MDKIKQALEVALGATIFCTSCTSEDIKLIQQAQTQLQTLKQHLKEIEWHNKDLHEFCCPACYGWRAEGHKPNCWLGEIVEEVGK